jgi:hypothetical protein
MDRQQDSKLELTTEDLDGVTGGVRNADTEAFHAFIGGMVKGFLDAGGGVGFAFAP